MPRGGQLGTPLVSKKKVANTYSPQHWESGWAAVEAYREWEDWEGTHPARDSNEAAQALGHTEYQIESWREGKTPAVVDALEAAEAAGWLAGTTDNDRGRGLARLLAWVYASGSLTRGPRGQLAVSFTIHDQGERNRMEQWADLANVKIRYDQENTTEKVTLARVDEHPQLFARVLIGMGAEAGRATERTQVPQAVTQDPHSPATRGFVATYLRNRGSIQQYWENRFGFREVRPEDYLDELATLFETVLDAEVYRMEKFVTMDVGPVREFLEAVDDIKGGIEW